MSEAYAGFDTFAYPGTVAMSWLKGRTNLRWVGFYLRSPSHSDASFMPHRAEIVAMGWGVAPIYVGQQTIGPGAHKVTAAQGNIDGADAAAGMANCGFPPRSFCYLDLENGPPFGAAQAAYVGAWIDALRAGGYEPGVYCSYLFAPQVAALRPGIRIWVFHVQLASAHNVSGPTYPTPDPSTSGFAGAASWQRDNEAHIVVDASGRRLAVDLSTSIHEDPSAPDRSVVAREPAAYDAAWLQRALNQLGARLDVDGNIGPATLAALVPVIEAALAKQAAHA